MINALILSDLSDAEHSVFKMMLGGDIKLKSTPKTIYNQKSALLKKASFEKPVRIDSYIWRYAV